MLSLVPKLPAGQKHLMDPPCRKINGRQFQKLFRFCTNIFFCPGPGLIIPIIDQTSHGLCLHRMAEGQFAERRPVMLLQSL